MQVLHIHNTCVLSKTEAGKLQNNNSKLDQVLFSTLLNNEHGSHFVKLINKSSIV